MENTKEFFIPVLFLLLIFFYYFFQLIKHLSKGQITIPSVRSKPPISFKQRPILASLILILLLSLYLIIIIFGIYYLFF